MRAFITIRTYLDLSEAELARAYLDAKGIDARVVEGTSFNPLLNAAAGGIRLEVLSLQADRAEALLAEYAAVGAEELDEPEGEPGADVVRCPRCELEYCFFERAPITSGVPNALVAILYMPFALFAPKRWHCRKCEHVWDDPAEGPRSPTRLQPDDPRPVFRMARAPSGRGLLIGVVLGLFLALALMHMSEGEGDLGGLLLVGMLIGSVLGWMAGSLLRADYCSAPGCREPLHPGAKACRACKGAVVGRVRSQAEHYAAAADFRRELAAAHAADAAADKKGKQRSKRRKPKEPAEAPPPLAEG